MAGWYTKGSGPEREDGRSQKEAIKDAKVRFQNGGMVHHMFVP